MCSEETSTIKEHARDQNIQKFLALSDWSETIRCEDPMSMGLSYGSLPRAQRFSSCSSVGQRSVFDHGQQIGGIGQNSPSHRQPVSHSPSGTLRIRPTVSEGYGVVPGRSSDGGYFNQPIGHKGYESYMMNPKLPIGTDYRPQPRPLWEAGDTSGSPIFSRPKAQGPKRVDMPPESDWRQNSFMPQFGGRFTRPTHPDNGTLSSSDAYGANNWTHACSGAAFDRNGW